MAKGLTSLALAALIGGSAVSAHHSFAVFFDDTKTIEITGNVTDFRFSNPHAIISLEVKNKAGMVEEWKAETNAVTLLKRRGWTKANKSQLIRLALAQLDMDALETPPQ